jgi:hypothetical protein
MLDIDALPLSYEMLFTRPWLDDPDVKHRIRYKEGDIDCVQTALDIAAEVLERLEEEWLKAGAISAVPTCQVFVQAPRTKTLLWDSIDTPRPQTGALTEAEKS